MRIAQDAVGEPSWLPSWLTLSAPRLAAVPAPSQVKNVEKIELGRYEMTTWYFSPLPLEFHGVKARGEG